MLFSLTGCNNEEGVTGLYETINVGAYEKEISISEDLEIPFSAQNYEGEAKEKYLLNWTTDYGVFVVKQGENKLTLGKEVLGNQSIIWTADDFEKKYFYVKLEVIDRDENEIVKTVNIDFEKRGDKLILKD
jgi:hypothetical protein